MSGEPKKISAVKMSNEQKEWHTYHKKEREETPKRLEESAKFLSGLTGLTLTLFLTGNDTIFLESSPALMKVASVFWLLSLLCTLWVIFPFRYAVNNSSAQSIEQTFKRVVRTKYRLLFAAAVFYFLGLGILTGIFICSVS